jgi:superfamily II DNA or RNA helicase
MNVLGVPRFWGLSQFGLPTTDHRKENPMHSIKPFQGKLRDLQVRCNSQALHMLQGWGGTTLLADCGFGKTATAIALALDLKQRTLILCNREILMHQWIQSIEQFATGPVG